MAFYFSIYSSNFLRERDVIQLFIIRAGQNERQFPTALVHFLIVNTSYLIYCRSTGLHLKIMNAGCCHNDRLKHQILIFTLPAVIMSSCQ